MNLNSIISNVLSLNSNNDYYLKNNNSHWVGEPCNSDLLHYRSSSVEFLFDYEKKYFDDVIKKTPSNRYFNKKVIYNLNDKAFRTYNLPLNEKKIFCFGCSCTFGLGLSDDETWPYIISNKFDNKLNIENFGTIGASSDTIARFVYQLRKLNPVGVIILFPSIFRKEYTTEEGKVLNFNVRSTSKNINIHEDYYKKSGEAYNGYLSLLNNNESFFNFIKNFNFISLLLKDIPFAWGSLCPTLHEQENILEKYISTKNMISLKLLKKLPNKYARDGEHYSYNYNEFIADKFYDVIKKNIV